MQKRTKTNEAGFRWFAVIDPTTERFYAIAQKKVVYSFAAPNFRYSYSKQKFTNETEVLNFISSNQPQNFYTDAQ